MPPFRTGLQKRKLESNSVTVEISENTVDNDEGTSKGDTNSEDEDLFRGEFNLEGDDTDSEPGEEADASDGEPDKVLYEDDADSTLGNEESDTGHSEESSELSDSETDHSESENEDKDAVGTSEDEEKSDAESGIGHTQSSGSESGRRSERSNPEIDRLAATIHTTSLATQPVTHTEEYESGDTSDEEERVNTVGDVPLWWYDEYTHVGYDTSGRRLARPPARDRIDDFLRRCAEPEFWRTVRDPRTAQDVVLSADDLRLLARLRAGLAPAAVHAPWVEWFTRDVLPAPLRAFPEHKRSFLPSRDEQRRVSRIVHALRMGWVKTRRQLALERRQRKEKKFYDLWGSAAPDEEERLRGVHRHIAAPKRPPPSHAESYNPPPEYLLDDKETEEWNALSETPWKRKYTFLPQRHASLRAVPAYERFVRERFLRCLDLYLAPRAVKMRLTISADELVPKLPSPRELQPFPTTEVLTFRGHAALVRSVDIDPSGRYAASGDDAGDVRVWELATGRCVRTLALGAGVARVAWVPAGGLALLAAAAGARLLLLAPGVGPARVQRRTDELLAEAPPAAPADARTAAAARWPRVEPAQWAQGVRLAVDHFKPVTHVSWHARGDYLVTTLRDAASRSVVVHQVSKRRSQLPFSKSKGLVQCAVFHPTKPLLFVVTQRAVRVYDLVKQELVRKLSSGAQWLSCAAVHPAGDNLVLGSYDRKAVWFDLELSARPYASLRLHAGAVRAVCVHRRYPLWASAGDDGAVVSHARVFADLLRSPLLVPLRRVAVPAREGLAALDAVFHPSQPWLLVAAADRTLRLYS